MTEQETIEEMKVLILQGVSTKDLKKMGYNQRIISENYMHTLRERDQARGKQ
ncbi:MAG: hypothetical protein OIN87_09165 [Candidatus Methanoperedens sp.]|nr:hypothetical protein [Candidatus Methanoperedens sp.]